MVNFIKENNMKHNITFWQNAIKEIEEDYGRKCGVYVEGCGCCEAGKVIEFIKRHIEFIESENDEEYQKSK